MGPWIGRWDHCVHYVLAIAFRTSKQLQQSHEQAPHWTGSEPLGSNAGAGGGAAGPTKRFCCACYALPRPRKRVGSLTQAVGAAAGSPLAARIRGLACYIICLQLPSMSTVPSSGRLCLSAASCSGHCGGLYKSFFSLFFFPSSSFSLF